MASEGGVRNIGWGGFFEDKVGLLSNCCNFPTIQIGSDKIMHPITVLSLIVLYAGPLFNGVV